MDNEKDLGADAAAVAFAGSIETLELSHAAPKLTRTVTFRAAYDKRHADPSKNCGIHGVEIRFVVSNEVGAVQFVLYTSWQLPHVTRELMGRHYAPSGGDPHWMERPMPADLGYHSPTPQYEGHTTASESCEYLGGRPCYYDGSSLAAERVFHVLLGEGDVGVWKLLEARHADQFGTATVPFSEALGSVPSEAPYAFSNSRGKG